jgi:hypothetical protein
MPGFVALLLNHRPRALRGHSLMEVMDLAERQPRQLVARFEQWRSSPGLMTQAPPTLALAVLGQAKVNGLISPEHESDTLASLLTHWAWKSVRGISAACAAQPRLRSRDRRLETVRDLTVTLRQGAPVQ